MDKSTRQLYELKADLFRAVAHPLRLAIVDMLCGGELCVCEIAERLGAERSNVSRHLAVMLKAGILESHKEGLRVIYSLKTPCVADIGSCVTRVLRERLETDRQVLQQL